MLRSAHWRMSWRELVGNLARFRIYIACLGVGAFAIAASGSVIESFRAGVNAQARQFLGGDVAFTVTHAPRARRSARGSIPSAGSRRRRGYGSWRHPIPIENKSVCGLLMRRFRSSAPW